MVLYLFESVLVLTHILCDRNSSHLAYFGESRYSINPALTAALSRGERGPVFGDTAALWNAAAC